jgi:hypothetical protein
MTDAEKTELRIKAAKAMGYKWYRRVSFDGQDRRILLHSDSEYSEGIKRGLFVECDESIAPYGDFLREAPNPLESDADCNALLIATIKHFAKKDRGFKLWHEIFRGLFWVRTEIENEPPNGDCREFDFNSDNPDLLAAYRECVTLACVAAWEAENSQQ